MRHLFHVYFLDGMLQKLVPIIGGNQKKNITGVLWENALKVQWKTALEGNIGSCLYF